MILRFLTLIASSLIMICSLLFYGLFLYTRWLLPVLRHYRPVVSLSEDFRSWFATILYFFDLRILLIDLFPMELNYLYVILIWHFITFMLALFLLCEPHFKLIITHSIDDGLAFNDSLAIFEAVVLIIISIVWYLIFLRSYDVRNAQFLTLDLLMLSYDFMSKPLILNTLLY